MAKMILKLVFIAKPSVKLIFGSQEEALRKNGKDVS